MEKMIPENQPNDSPEDSPKNQPEAPPEDSPKDSPENQHEDPYARANAKARKRKIVQDREVASKKIKKGLLIVHTGNGKGKSTAAFGMALRAIGHGRNVAVIQFTKGRWRTGEKRFFEKYDADTDKGGHLMLDSVGDGFTWETQDRAADIARAEKGWEKVCALVEEARADPSRWGMIVLDELNIVLRYGYLDLDMVVATLRDRPRDLHIVVTGRGAKPSLCEAADLVTEMTLVKHHYRAGVKAQKGIEF